MSPILLVLSYSFILSALALTRASQLTDINGRFQPLSFSDAFSVIWGDAHVTSEDGSNVQLKLDKNSGSGFVSLDNYLYGFYSASIKLPEDYTAGIVLAFYTSNGDEFSHNHDELDFEFLGNVKGKPWRMQTNIYGNGSVSRGREERFNFWFDPTADFHNYSLLWNEKHIVFMVDNIPIREMKNRDALGGDYPSKPMALYATVWDGSSWATDGGKYAVNYKYAPFITRFKNLNLEGCATNPILEEETSRRTECIDNPVKAPDLWSLTSSQQHYLEWVRRNYLYYTYCQDKSRYPIPLPECASQTPVKRIKAHGYKSHQSKQRPRTLTSRKQGNF